MSTATDSDKAERIAREIAREREQRHRHDETKTDGFSDDDLRLKDARQSGNSGRFERHRPS
ncbi:MAG: hypothetical protein ACJ8GW_00595 [Massilia sp.]